MESFTDKIPYDSPIKRKQDNSGEDQQGGGFINEQLFKLWWNGLLYSIREDGGDTDKVGHEEVDS